MSRMVMQPPLAASASAPPRPLRRRQNRAGHSLCFVLLVLGVIILNEDRQQLPIQRATELHMLPSLSFVNSIHNNSSSSSSSSSGNDSGRNDSITIKSSVGKHEHDDARIDDDKDDELIWKLQVPPEGGFKQMPMFTLCEWYGTGVHRRRSHRRRHRAGSTKIQGNIIHKSCDEQERESTTLMNASSNTIVVETKGTETNALIPFSPKVRLSLERLSCKTEITTTTSSSNNNNIVIVESSNQVIKNVLLPPSGKLTLSLALPCQEIATKHDSGTGNWIQQHYILRMAAMLASHRHSTDPSQSQFNLDISCADGGGMQHTAPVYKTLVLPWLSGNFSGTQDLQTLQAYWTPPQLDSFLKLNSNACEIQKGWYDAPVLYMLPFIRDDLRRMAIRLVGIPTNNPDHPAHSYLLSSNDINNSDDSNSPLPPPPLLSDVELDDVAIHFRCGDIMLSERWHMFHFLKFRFFADRIPLNNNNTTSSISTIGIVTQPFRNQSNVQTRKLDIKNELASNICMNVVLSFQQYLQNRFPLAKVSIRNGPEESIALSLSRLVMARYAFAAPDSTFSVFPVLATFGNGFLVHALPGGMLRGFSRDQKILNGLATTNNNNNLVFARADAKRKHEVMSATKTFELTRTNATRGAEQILEWFRNDNYFLP